MQIGMQSAGRDSSALHMGFNRFKASVNTARSKKQA